MVCGPSSGTVGQIHAAIVKLPEMSGGSGTSTYEPMWVAWSRPGWPPSADVATGSALKPGLSGEVSPWMRRTTCDS